MVVSQTEELELLLISAYLGQLSWCLSPAQGRTGKRGAELGHSDGVVLGEAELELRCIPPKFTSVRSSCCSSPGAGPQSCAQSPPHNLYRPSVGLSLPMLGGGLPPD